MKSKQHKIFWNSSRIQKKNRRKKPDRLFIFEFRHKWLFNHFTCDFDYAIHDTLQNDGTKQNTGDETRCEPIGHVSTAPCSVPAMK
jgi:hypothetical protein